MTFPQCKEIYFRNSKGGIMKMQTSSLFECGPDSGSTARGWKSLGVFLTIMTLLQLANMTRDASLKKLKESKKK
jgi:hypothetical protein